MRQCKHFGYYLKYICSGELSPWQWHPYRTRESLSFTHTQMLKCITRYPLASTHSVGSVCLNQFTEEKIGAKIWNKKFRLFLNCFYAISSKKKNGSRFILPATTIIIDIIITTMYCSLICKHPLLNKRP